MDIEKLIEECAETTAEKGFDVSQHSTQMLLIGTEVAEALRELGTSENKDLEMYIAMFMAVCEGFEKYRRDHKGEHIDSSTLCSPFFIKELAGLQIRLWSYIGGNGFIDEYLKELKTEMAYNKTRPYKHGKGF